MTQTARRDDRDGRLRAAASDAARHGRSLHAIALTAAFYAGLAVLGALYQIGPVPAAADVGGAAAWLLWWQLSAVIAAAGSIGCFIGARVLHHLSAAVSAFSRDPAADAGVDDYR